MQLETGCKHSQIWLIGDSPPPRWEERLTEPLDPRHPSRHNIWTPIADGIQEKVFQATGQRVDTRRIYVRNAVSNYEKKRDVKSEGWSKLQLETTEFKKLLDTYKPPLVFTFGAFSFEFANRSLERNEREAHTNWNTIQLGNEFRRAVRAFSPSDVNVIPLLHASIARGKFLESHHYFTGDVDGNYFDYVAQEISELLLKHGDSLSAWINRQSMPMGL